jgi:TRAP-type C4-dicarboxylate transport system permease small subunit
LDRAFDRAARFFGLAAAVFLIAMMMVTVADVSLRSAFDIPIFGTFDLVELFLVASVFLAIPGTFLREEHVVVDVIDHIAPSWLTAGLRWTGTVLTLAFLVLMLSQMIEPALDKIEFGDVTLELSIPKYIHWIPILLGVFFSALAVAAILVRNVLRRDRVGQ